VNRTGVSAADRGTQDYELAEGVAVTGGGPVVSAGDGCWVLEGRAAAKGSSSTTST